MSKSNRNRVTNCWRYSAEWPALHWVGACVIWPAPHRCPRTPLPDLSAGSRFGQVQCGRSGPPLRTLAVNLFVRMTSAGPAWECENGRWRSGAEQPKHRSRKLWVSPKSRRPLVALSWRENRVGECLLLSAKQTLMAQTSMSANDPIQPSKGLVTCRCLRAAQEAAGRRWLSKKSMLSKDPLVKLHGEPHVALNERRASMRD